MGDHKQARHVPGGTAATSAAIALGVVVAAAALAGCSSGTGTAQARAAADIAKASLSATAGTGGNGAVITLAMLLQDGIQQAETHDWAAAATTFDDVLTIAPRDVYALYNLGLIDQSTGNVPGAENYYRQAIADNAGYTPALYNLAIALENSDPAGAAGLYKKIVAINPQASTAYLRLAFVYAEQGKLEQARAAQAKALAIDPGLGKYPLPTASR